MEKESSRKDILQLEKRLVELELAVTELKESIKSIDLSMVPDLKQRVEDIEDLVMVEQAGILELKKLLEESKPEKPEKPIPEDLEQRLASIESNIPNLVEKTELESKLESIQKDLSSLMAKPAAVEIEGLYNKLAQLEGNLSILKSQTESISKELYEKVKEISKKKLELDLKITEMIKKIDILENKIRESPSQEILDELKLNKREIISTNARIDSLEMVARELMNDIQNVKNSVKRFESFEKVSILSKEIEEKIERFKFIEDEMRRLSSRVELIYDSIDKRLDKIRDLEKRVPELTETVSKLSKEMDKNRIEILDKTREEISRRIASVERVKSSLEREISKSLEEKFKTIEKRKAEEVNRILTDITMKIAVIESRIASIETNYEKKIDEFRSAVREKLVEIRAQPSLLDDQVKEIVNKIVFLESRLMGIESMMREKREALPIIIE